MKLPMWLDTKLKRWDIIWFWNDASKSIKHDCIYRVDKWSVYTYAWWTVQNTDITFYQIPSNPSYGMPEDKDMLIIALVIIIIALLVALF